MMNSFELNRHFNELNIAKIRRLIDEGNSAQTIKRETGLSMRLINAVFKKVQNETVFKVYLD